MDKTRILPPRVRGRVTGVLDFFVDEIRLFQNILLLTDNFDLVLQVQWWGEVLPVFIRPKELHVEGKKRRQCQLLEAYYHSAQYEIKTTLDLFKTYLKNCEVLELSVLNTFENDVIGSAFLKDLLNVLYSNNEPIRIPVFDYLGEEIGEVVIHINFLQKPHQDKDVIPNKRTVMFESNSSDKKDSIISSKMKSHSFTVAEKTIFYDSQSRNNLHEKVVITDAGFPVSSFNVKKPVNSSHSNLNLPVSDKNLYSSQETIVNNKFIRGDKESIGLPEIQSKIDASKILYFGVTSERQRQKTGMKKSKITNKFNSNSVRCKSKHPEKLGRNPIDKISRKSISKKGEACKKSGKNSTKIEKELDFKSSSTSSEPDKSEMHQLYESANLKNIPSKQSPNIKVLDYLLGSDMSKDDEESALNDFKKLSPSHNLVDSISQLCLLSHKDSPKGPNNSPASLKQNVLNFDLNNPIERIYYERFFLKSNSDFEIAELLNQPENSFMLRTFDGVANPKTKSPSSSLKSVSKNSFTKRDTKEDEEAGDCLINVSLPDRRNSCARCKYYKKLNELDAIIESLKHFEEKMLSHEKDLKSAFKENPDRMIKRDRF